MSEDKRIDPKGLIAEAYSMEGLTRAECRSIFLDWALSAPEGVDIQTLVGTLMARHGEDADHPMTQVLREGLEQSGKPRRRGGWKSRHRPEPEG